MQNRYAGDIGDYSKFVLMKHLFGDKDIGIVWYLYPDESHNNDGLHKEYEKYGLKDEELSEILKNVANSKNRNINILMESLYEKGYFDRNKIKEFKNVVGTGETPAQRRQKRNEWMKGAKSAIEGCSVVFVDPDNGLQVKSYGKGSKKGGKYIYFDEAREFFDDAKVLIIYQHFPRQKHDEYIKKRLKEIKSKIPGDYELYAIKFDKVSPRVYFILVKKDVKNDFCTKLKDFFENKFSRSKERYVFVAYDSEGKQIYLK